MSQASRLTRKYSPAYSKVRNHTNKELGGVPNYMRDELFETTAMPGNVYEMMDSHSRKALSDYSTSKPLFEADQPRAKGSMANTGMLNARYNGGRGTINVPNHGEFFLSDMGNKQHTFKGDFRPLIEDQKLRYEKTHGRRMPMDSGAADTIGDTQIKPWEITHVKQKLHKFMAKRLVFDDGDYSLSTKRINNVADSIVDLENMSMSHPAAIDMDFWGPNKQLEASNYTGSLNNSQTDHRRPTSTTNFMLLKQGISAADMDAAIGRNVILERDLMDKNGISGNVMSTFSGKHNDATLKRDTLARLVSKLDGVRPDQREQMSSHRERNFLGEHELRMMAHGVAPDDKTRETVAIRNNHGEVDGIATVLQSGDSKVARSVDDAINSLRKSNLMKDIGVSQMLAFEALKSAVSIGGDIDNRSIRTLKQVLRKPVSNDVARHGTEREDKITTAETDHMETASYKHLPEGKPLVRIIHMQNDADIHEGRNTNIRPRNVTDRTSKGTLSEHVISGVDRNVDNTSMLAHGGKKFKIAKFSETTRENAVDDRRHISQDVTTKKRNVVRPVKQSQLSVTDMMREQMGEHIVNI